MVLGTEAGIRVIVWGLCSSYNFLSNDARLVYLRLTPFVIFHALRNFFCALRRRTAKIRRYGGPVIERTRLSHLPTRKSPDQGTRGFRRALETLIFLYISSMATIK